MPRPESLAALVTMGAEAPPAISTEGEGLTAAGVRLVQDAAKTVLLIRHAESENNVSKRVARHCCRRGGCCCRAPSCSEICSVLSMVTCPMNTRLSAEGQQQVELRAHAIADACIAPLAVCAILC
eukprot:SAG31_NODE_244_length_19246_cov_20.233823_10_plen_125_part_00